MYHCIIFILHKAFYLEIYLSGYFLKSIKQSKLYIQSKLLSLYSTDLIKQKRSVRFHTHTSTKHDKFLLLVFHDIHAVIKKMRTNLLMVKRRQLGLFKAGLTG